jgi:hypothetical protein
MEEKLFIPSFFFLSNHLPLFQMEGEIQRLRALERAAAKDLAHSNNIVELRKVSKVIFISSK